MGLRAVKIPQSKYININQEASSFVVAQGFLEVDGSLDFYLGCGWSDRATKPEESF
ncbi:hypothetical protein H6F74_08135 [Trichocoleus sp. FACHB-90]|uniref:hypothetical protein n=1 Tax=Cyanophyceae TaxID=3028117 RepID=UPI0016838CA7|nr:hypothetical protein [Trichocoleus sp. FACHB-90]MBD1926218.1 hypothetical protein [Trichocoleus sp. FACHB-90]